MRTEFIVTSRNERILQRNSGVKTAIYTPKAAGTDTHLSAKCVSQALDVGDSHVHSVCVKRPSFRGTFSPLAVGHFAIYPIRTTVVSERTT